MLQVEAVRGIDLLHVHFDSQAGFIGDSQPKNGS
jgi:hypothetical protein